ncbi:MAG TPA: diguanylate cyclase, partial [Pseudomonas sp.]|nr:diguanylate cyclase [Pseudomonas sp.]
MKIHTDAASRLATEVVTQLPVPSRLGMLRFERLNEPSWTLLFLDPTCERAFGVSAGDLCSLVDSPYASLMEPSTRHQLHEDIQQQLAGRNHYQVGYRLHTPDGVLDITELGEVCQQYGRELLRGYLLAGRHPESDHDLRTQNARLRMALQEREQAQDEHVEHMLRSRTQQSLIVRLARHRYGSA